jgi:hypothetical protein
MNATATEDAHERRLRIAVELLARGVRRALGREPTPIDDEVDDDLTTHTASSRANAENQALPVREREALMGRAATASDGGDEDRERRNPAR